MFFVCSFLLWPVPVKANPSFDQKAICLWKANVECFSPQILPRHTHSFVKTDVPALGSGGMHQRISLHNSKAQGS